MHRSVAAHEMRSGHQSASNNVVSSRCYEEPRISASLLHGLRYSCDILSVGVLLRHRKKRVKNIKYRKSLVIINK